MAIEYEATFPRVNKDKIRVRLHDIGAVLEYPETLQKRSNFDPPQNKDNSSWLRVRDEGRGVITMSYKTVPDKADVISQQKEICLRVNSFEDAKSFLVSLGCREKSYQETRRELWRIGKVEITIDEWPFLVPFLEIESDSEVVVKNIAEKLGYDYREALFCNVFYLYSQQYNIPIDDLKKMVSGELGHLTFSSENPFSRQKK
ncbi:MAG: CYTH domain-containing protein [Candidatus Paceibacterota bacterium]